MNERPAPGEPDDAYPDASWACIRYGPGTLVLSIAVHLFAKSLRDLFFPSLLSAWHVKAL